VLAGRADAHGLAPVALPRDLAAGLDAPDDRAGRNEAYRRLKDPLARGAYLCELRGAPIGAESNTAMPREFLLQQMAWREALDDAADSTAVQALDAEVAEHERALLELLRQQLDEQGDAQGAANTVRALMFTARFRQDVDRRLEALEL